MVVSCVFGQPSLFNANAVASLKQTRTLKRTPKAKRTHDDDSCWRRSTIQGKDEDRDPKSTGCESAEGPKTVTPVRQEQAACERAGVEDGQDVVADISGQLCRFL